MKKIGFNWTEIKTVCRSQNAEILLLTYAIVIGYNNYIAYEIKDINNRLNTKIVSVNELCKKGLLTFNPYGQKKGIYSKIMVNNPQSYFINQEFLYRKCPARLKVEYLFMLSHRPYNDLKPYIEKRYFPETLHSNLFVKKQGDYLILLPELSKLKQEKTTSDRRN